MINKFTLAAVIASSIFAMTSLSNSASACGFIGCIVEEIAPGAGKALDQWNAENGQPVEHAAAAAMEVYVPGAGQTYEAYLAVRQAQEAQAAHQRAQQQAQGIPQMTGFPQAQQTTNFPQMGSFCGTGAGRFGPGPFQPVGAPCWANTQFGPMNGSIVP